MAEAAAPERLIGRAFIALAVATLAFLIAAGIILPAAPEFAREALGEGPTGVGMSIASFSIAALVFRLVAGVTGHGPTFLVSVALALSAGGLLLARRASVRSPATAETG